jgi:outer membrane protein TolC
MLFFTLFGFLQLAAQQKSLYSLSTLVDSAVKYYPLILQKQALVNSAQASVKDVKHSYLPSLNISDEVSMASVNQLPGSTLPIEIIPSISGGSRAANNWQPATTNTGVLYSEYLLADFGLKNAKIKTAELFGNIQQSDLQRNIFLLKASVTQTYLQLVQTQFRLNAEKMNVDRYEYIFNLIKSLTQSGLIAGVDSSLAKAELSKARSAFNQVNGVWYQLKDQLSFYTGISPVKIIIDTSTGVYQPKILPEQYLIDSNNHPFIDYYIKKRNFNLANEKLIAKSYQPKILIAGSTWARGSSITYNDQYKSLSSGLGYERFNYAAGVSFVYDLFSGIHKKDKLLVSRYETAAADYELQQQKISLNNSLIQSQDAIKIAENNLNELPIQMKAAQEVYQQKVAQYKAGLINLIDLNNASFVLYRSQLDFIDTMNSWYIAVFNKAAATNNLDQFIQQIK